jgi:glycosyltransferase involved in cell wall biosynthesis
MPKVILISQVPLPFSNIGSWTTLYKNFFQDNPTIDYIVCPEPTEKWETVNYSFVERNTITQFQKKWKKNPYLGYLKALNKVLQPNEKYIIQIVDNFGIVKFIVDFIQKKEMRQHVYLQFFYHGFSPFYENFQGRWFFEAIDEMVLLTKDSYIAHRNYYTVLPIRFSVLPNGIDTTQFFPLTLNEKQTLKQSKGMEDKTVFVWCSQDRPKKGLHLLLDVWRRIYTQRQDVILWVIGCEPKSPQEGVVYLGRIPNQELPCYLQASDCYLFPTLWHEGFGLSLIEALHCGNYCIASALGGVPEVLQYGKFGKLIENPHFVSAWEKAILEFIENPRPETTISPDLYSSKSWNEGMNALIDRAKESIQSL